METIYVREELEQLKRRELAAICQDKHIPLSRYKTTAIKRKDELVNDILAENGSTILKSKSMRLARISLEYQEDIIYTKVQLRKYHTFKLRDILTSRNISFIKGGRALNKRHLVKLIIKSNQSID